MLRIDEVWIDDDGHEWHSGCNGRVYGFKEGAICASCGAQSDWEDFNTSSWEVED